MHTCNSCKKGFKTAQGLADHTRAAHAKGTVTKQIRQQKMTAPVSVPTSSGGARYTNRTTVLRGDNERLRTEDFGVAKLKTNNLLTVIPVHAQMVGRLADQARAYQRVKFHKVELIVDAKGSTNLSGGYLVAFISDASAAEVPLSEAGEYSGSVGRKFWENARVEARNLAPHYYTSRGDDDRLYSPGYFAVYCDGTSDGPVSFTFRVTWSVTLSIPSKEKETIGVVVATQDLWSKKGSQNLRDDTVAKSTSALFDPEVPPGTVLQLPSPVGLEYAEGTGDTGTISCWFLIAGAGRTLVYSQDRGPLDPKYVWQADLPERLLLPRGLKLKVTSGPENSASGLNTHGSVSTSFSGMSGPITAGSRGDSFATSGHLGRKSEGSGTYEDSSLTSSKPSQTALQPSSTNLQGKPLGSGASRSEVMSRLLGSMQRRTLSGDPYDVPTNWELDHEYETSMARPEYSRPRFFRLKREYDPVPLARGKRHAVITVVEREKDKEKASLSFTLHSDPDWEVIHRAFQVLSLQYEVCLWFVVDSLYEHLTESTDLTVFPIEWDNRGYHNEGHCRCARTEAIESPDSWSICGSE